MNSSMQEDETGVIPVKPKKLAGAVSMFGGIDPAMVGRTRSSGRPPVTEKPNKPGDNSFFNFCHCMQR